VEKKILKEEEINLGMKVRHLWIVPELTVVDQATTDAEISLRDARREARDRYLFLGDEQESYFKF
jgi:hypothetical protein